MRPPPRAGRDRRAGPRRARRRARRPRRRTRPRIPRAAAAAGKLRRAARLDAAGLRRHRSRSRRRRRPYATDASHYAAAGAPVLVLGPGDIAQAHTKDEWLHRAELASAVALYAALLALPA
ncbi:M20/M25/M40 family metallo-hydrolase [Oleiharenicola sp. Vm1]|uniref:M20/M25/M40 family metallo-hydrolase n=1 Tax=Oleiharenicola sp. Vm1 TaxID=3398393 RepID=UPI0039F55865